jgi:hypothetical protein
MQHGVDRKVRAVRGRIVHIASLAVLAIPPCPLTYRRLEGLPRRPLRDRYTRRGARDRLVSLRGRGGASLDLSEQLDLHLVVQVAVPVLVALAIIHERVLLIEVLVALLGAVGVDKVILSAQQSVRLVVRPLVFVPRSVEGK